MKIVQTIKKEKYLTQLLKLDEKALTKYMHKKFMEISLVVATPLEHNTFQNYKYESKGKLEIFSGSVGGSHSGFMDVGIDLTGIQDICVYGAKYFLDTHKITQELENIIDGYIAKLVVKMEGIKNEQK